MRFRALQPKIVAVVALAMMNSLADPAAIGIATSSGHFRVDNNKVLRNATVFEGTAVETGEGTGQLRLASANVAFDSNTRGVVYKNRVILDRGKIQWTGGPGFRADAGPVRITGDTSAAKAIVLRQGEQVQVASLAGTVSVRNAAGALVSTVAAGTAMAFEQDPQAGASGSTGTTTGTTTGTKTGTTTGAGTGSGLTTGTITAITLGAAAAVIIPVAIVASGDDKKVSGQ